MITRMRDVSSRYIAESAMLFLSSFLPFPHPCISSFYISATKKARYWKHRALTYLSIGFYSSARNCNKKSPCPEGQRLTMNGRNLIDGRCFANRLSMQWMGAFLLSVADSPRLSLFCEYVFSSMRHMELHGMWLCEGILSMPPILRQGMIAVLCSL